MNRFLSCLLSLSILWMSTWLVTDIHGVHAGNRPHVHPLLQVATLEKGAVLSKGAREDGKGKGSSPHCHFCSYDHGGHVGTLVPAVETPLSVALVPASVAFIYTASWFHLITPPQPRPPIV